jgi:hypothetical protein
MNDLIRYTDIATILAADTVAFCCFIDTIEGVLPKYKIVEFQEDYEGRYYWRSFSAFRHGMDVCQSAEEL